MSSLVVIVANPVSSGASERKLREAEALLRARGLNVDVLLTERRGDAERLAREAAAKSPRFVLAAGGDGTFGEVANGLSGTDVPMALLPIGLVNILALEVGVPIDVKGAIDKTVTGSPHNITLGSIEMEGQRRVFCLMAGIGFDASCVSDVNLTLKRYLGKGAYVIRGLQALSSWAPEKLEIEIDRSKTEGYSLIVSNTARYAGEFRVSPDADITSPSLDVFVMHGRRRSDMLRYALGILSGRHRTMKDVTFEKATRIEIRGSAPVQTDGDHIGSTPATITALPNILKLIY